MVSVYGRALSDWPVVGAPLPAPAEVASHGSARLGSAVYDVQVRVVYDVQSSSSDIDYRRHIAYMVDRDR